jgi:hypothetical protein
MTAKQERARIAMDEATKRLKEEGIHFEQKSAYHLKIGSLNFWPNTGVIFRDGGRNSDKNGLDGFIELVRGPVSKPAPRPALHLVPPDLVPPDLVPPASKGTIENHQPTRRPQREFEGIKFGNGMIVATPEALAARNKKRQS